MIEPQSPTRRFVVKSNADRTSIDIHDDTAVGGASMSMTADRHGEDVEIKVLDQLGIKLSMDEAREFSRALFQMVSG